MQRVCVIGLGYIGLPTASLLATYGFRVTGVDINSEVVSIIQNGKIHIEEPGLNALVQAAVKSGRLIVQTKPEKSDIFIIAVPTPITREKRADMSCVKEAIRSIAPLLSKDNLIILESTSPPGTCKDIVVPILESFNLVSSEDYYLAYCPERVWPGNTLKELIQNDRIIGGINMESAKRAAQFYKEFVEGNIYLTDSTTAEMVKLMENTYRDVNIALANELAKICEKIGINVWEVVKLANLHPRVNIHSPGPGVGGHCIAVDPYFIVEKFSTKARIISVSRNINDNMPIYVAKQIKKIVQKIDRPKIAIFGVAYKENIDDVRESPALRIIEELEKNGLLYSIYDPHVKKFKYTLSSLKDTLQDSDCIVIMTKHKEFMDIKPQKIRKFMRNKYVYDTRNCINHKSWMKSGFKVYCLGVGDL